MKSRFACFVAAFLALVGSAFSQQPAKPNFIVFLADDLGWGDLGCQGHPIIKTPNLDAFAKQGVRLTQCYSASAVCSPSRSAILTGRTPFRNGVYTWIPEGKDVYLRTSEVALPKLLKQQGYATCHVGKWHLNGKFNNPAQPQPNDHGYDWWLATQNNAAPSHEQPTNFVRNGQPIGKVENYSALFVVEEAVQWLKQHRDPNQPFFLAVWTHEPHYPIKSAEQFKSQYADLTDRVQVEHHANVTQLDAAFGNLMRALDEMKLADSTLVFFTSDNGPEGDGVTSPGRGSTGGLRGRKRAMYEGGIRVPGLARWPGRIPAGTTADAPVVGFDIYPMILRQAGAQPPADRPLDGADVFPVLSGEAQTVARKNPLYWRLNMAPGPKLALRDGDWKILSDGELAKFELYNLKDDPQETTDLAQREPDRLASLAAELKRLNAEIVAEGPDWWQRDIAGTDTPKPSTKSQSKPKAKSAGKKQSQS